MIVWCKIVRDIYFNSFRIPFHLYKVMHWVEHSVCSQLVSIRVCPLTWPDNMNKLLKRSWKTCVPVLARTLETSPLSVLCSQPLNVWSSRTAAKQLCPTEQLRDVWLVVCWASVQVHRLPLLVALDLRRFRLPLIIIFVIDDKLLRISTRMYYELSHC